MTSALKGFQAESNCISFWRAFASPGDFLGVYGGLCDASASSDAVMSPSALLVVQAEHAAGSLCRGQGLRFAAYWLVAGGMLIASPSGSSWFHPNGPCGECCWPEGRGHRTFRSGLILSGPGDDSEWCGL